ncbi:acyltransferase 3 [Carnobacterium sp. 17-4]|uniref:acyltransferase n=1 Tax=Carnobacterium sp. (strain 17-4) TaxID=208596 RepID=UPI0002058EC3|nr:acyltransferase family protein [Carnobacterium sp. 17-4]AEB30231.1 acyltransferase 3 [Carnobacterium sp. 17-4]
MKERVLYADILRVAATFLVITIHIVSRDFELYAIDSYQWQVLNIYDSFARMSVPIFFMLSGIFFLDPNRAFSIKKLYQKNIFRLVTTFIFWSALYAAFFTWNEYRTFNAEVWGVIVEAFKEGHFHLWFLFRMIEIYVMIPFLRKIAEEKKIILYLIAFCWYVGIILPSYYEFPVSSTVTFAERGINLDITFGYVGYFFAGYYLAHYDLKKWIKVAIYLLGVAGLVSTIVVTSIESLKQGKHIDLHYQYLTPNVFFMSAAVFLLAKEKLHFKSVSTLFRSVLTEFSNYSFGIYLIHVLLIFLVWKTGVTTLFMTPILSVPILTTMIFCISYICVKGMAQLPIIKRFI